MNAYQFFLSQAGYSFDPKLESRMQGRIRNARALAVSERKARNEGYSFDWREDDCDSSEWSDESPAYVQWVCVMRDSSGAIVQSIYGVDFGRDGLPWNNSYRRVVEAELALNECAPACFK